MAGENPEVAINVAGLAKTFGEVRALDGLDLQIQAGTVFGSMSRRAASIPARARSYGGPSRSCAETGRRCC